MKINENELEGLWYYVDEKRWNGFEYAVYPKGEETTKNNIILVYSTEDAKNKVADAKSYGKEMDFIASSSLVYTLGTAIDQPLTKVHTFHGKLDIEKMNENRLKRLYPDRVKIPMQTDQSDKKNKRIKGRRAT